MHTTGAQGTAKENGLLPGVRASVEMAKRDLERIRNYSSVIKKVAEESGIDPAVIAAIISQDQTQLEDNLEEKICEVTNKLFECIKAIRSECPTWTKEQQFKGGIVTYKGARIRSCHNVDEYTPGGDYSNDVVARAQWFKKKINF